MTAAAPLRVVVAARGRSLEKRFRGGGIALTGDEYEVGVTYSPFLLPSGCTLTLSTDDIHLYWMMCAFIIFLCVVAFKVCSDVAHFWSGAYQLR